MGYRTRGFALLELLLVCVLVVLLAFLALHLYGKKSPVVSDQLLQQQLNQQQIDTSSYKSTLDTTRERLKDLIEQENNREKAAEDLMK